MRTSSEQSPLTCPTACAAGEAAIALATPAHRADLLDRLAASVDVQGARADGRLAVLDARETLSQFVVDGRPDPDRFARTIGPVLARATAAGTGVRAFGEMVALLWDDGNSAGAVDLEAVWNDFAAHHEFSLYCAYPLASLLDCDLRTVRHVCDNHSEVFAARPGPAPAPCRRADIADRELFVLDADTPAAVGAHVIGVLIGWLADQDLLDAGLVASELTHDAVRFAGGPIRVSVDRIGTTVRIAVADTSRRPPRAVQRAEEFADGRGLSVVADVCANWGWVPFGTGRTVWAELPGRLLR